MNHFIIIIIYNDNHSLQPTRRVTIQFKTDRESQYISSPGKHNDDPGEFDIARVLLPPIGSVLVGFIHHLSRPAQSNRFRYYINFDVAGFYGAVENIVAQRL